MATLDSGATATEPAPEPQPTPYRISTITFNGDLNVYIQGMCFYEHATLVPLTTDLSGFVWIEYWNKGEQKTRGTFPKRKVQSKRGSKKKATAAGAAATAAATVVNETDGGGGGADTTEKPKNKSFDNQTSMYYRMMPNYIPHVKLFKNGNIHITGLRTIDDGMRILTNIKEEIERIFHTISQEILLKPEDIQKINISKPIIRLINSDFHIPFKIRRKELHQLLIDAPYHNICSFQPGTYPGVKLEYYWNPNNEKKDGCCRCAKPCFGKANSKNAQECKKVTVAIFDSGSILITGATSHGQVDDAYRFICEVIMSHRDYLKKNLPKLPGGAAAP
jgi:TATA-box binding protein (TBP) (component of TFIID and TFIIIB)